MKYKIAATKEKIGAVYCIKCQSVLSNCTKKRGICQVSYHACKFSADRRNTGKHLHVPSLHIPQKVRDKVTKACVSLWCKDTTPFGIVTGCGSLFPMSKRKEVRGQRMLICMLKMCYHVLLQFPTIHIKKLKSCTNH